MTGREFRMTREEAVITLLGAISAAMTTVPEDREKVGTVSLAALLTLGVTNEEIGIGMANAPFFQEVDDETHQ